jgi:hypothetical protein
LEIQKVCPGILFKQGLDGTQAHDSIHIPHPPQGKADTGWYFHGAATWMPMVKAFVEKLPVELILDIVFPTKDGRPTNPFQFSSNVFIHRCAIFHIHRTSCLHRMLTMSNVPDNR